MAEAGRLDILVIEDDADTRANLSDILALDDFGVTAVRTVGEALEQASLDRYFAILLDRSLPDGKAEAVLPRLRQRAAEAAILIITGYRDLDVALSCLRQGAADYILKPIRPEALRATLGTLAEHHRLRHAQKQSEANFRHLVEAAECLIVILRDDGRIAYFSPFACEITGYVPAELVGRSFLELFLAPAKGTANPSLDEVFRGSTARGFELPVRCKEGSWKSILWNARRMDDYEGAPGLLAVGQDITERKLAEARLLQSERLAAIGQMVTGLAHESRNALQRSKACLEMLTSEVADRSEALDLVKRIAKAHDHLHRLYEEVRSYAAPIHLRHEPCSLGEVWRESWSSLSLLRDGKDLALIESLGRVDLQTTGDSFALGQVFRNILENAIAASPNPGRIEIHAAAARLSRQPAVELRFRDQGPGLNPEQRQRIFEPFFTTKSKGTGLGMAIALRIVEAHGGTIEVGTSPGPGAEIVVRLPKGRPAAP
jgi:hypothetical protein